MFECECLPRCPFFHDQMANMPSTAELIKKKFCSGPTADNTHCARHMVFVRLGREGVPSDLYPSDVEQAQSILRG
ncbi:MAG: hypothetical protein JW733_06520 [Coriobacteriia bacterium]|nr:hypothetical protein [Coriobacteriia bacterium]MBN2847918.1 hypothetical protein [Coriobacteriia bacterium]